MGVGRAGQDAGIVSDLRAVVAGRPAVISMVDGAGRLAKDRPRTIHPGAGRNTDRQSTLEGPHNRGAGKGEGI